MTLKNEFHDILPGSSIREVYEDAERELEGVIAAASEAQERALAQLAARAAPGGAEDAVLIANPSLDARPLESGYPRRRIRLRPAKRSRRWVFASFGAARSRQRRGSA